MIYIFVRNLLWVFFLSSTIYIILIYLIEKEAFFWTFLVAVPMLLLSLIQPAVPLSKKYQLASFGDFLMPAAFFLIVAILNPQEIQYLVFRIIPGFLFFITMGCLSKILLGWNKKAKNGK